MGRVIWNLSNGLVFKRATQMMGSLLLMMDINIVFKSCGFGGKGIEIMANNR